MFQEVEAPRFQDNRHMKVVRLSALRTGRLYRPGNIPGIHFCWRLSRTQGHSATRRIMSVTPSGIEPATFRLVAQCLNQLRYGVPYVNRKHNLKLLDIRHANSTFIPYHLFHVQYVWRWQCLANLSFVTFSKSCVVKPLLH